MPDRLEAAFVFGSLGNLTGALGDGWSEEDNYAWALGDESRLILPLPGDEGTYTLRFTVHPLVHPGVRESQRLRIATGETELGSFDLPQRATIEVPLPIGLTRHRHRIDLILTHPDAVRPRDFKESPDSRWLTVCFHSGGLVRTSAGFDGETDGEAADVLHAVIAGHNVARQIASVMSKLSLLEDRITFHYVGMGGTVEATVQTLPPWVLRSAQVYWEQSDVGSPDVAAALRGMLPDDCEVRRMPSPHMTALWPLQGTDPRLVREPGRYDIGRYPFTDRVGASLANMMLPDDVMILAYESMAEKEVPNLDAYLEADVDAWRRLDAANDVQVADFIVDNFRRQRLFCAPPHATPALLRHMIDQLVATPAIEAAADPTALRREIDFVMAGWVGCREELPVHPHVARHFDLSWWQPDMHYRWFGNEWTFEQYALDYIRWNPWRP